MDDPAGSSMPQQADDKARHTLTVRAVALLLQEAGVLRSERRIKHFCQIGTLTAKKFPTPTGPQWFVDPASVPGAIGDLKQFDAQIRSRKEHAATDPGSLKKDQELMSDAAGSSVLAHAATELKNQEDAGLSQHAATAYVSQLEKRIEEKDEVIGLLKDQLTVKDEQIARHSDRDRETNLLIRGLQNLVLRLQPGQRHDADVFDGDPLMKGSAVDNSAPTNEAVGV